LPIFRDYWRSKPGRDGVKADWDAVWRNWLRRSGDFKPAQQQPQGFVSTSCKDGVRMSSYKRALEAAQASGDERAAALWARRIDDERMRQ
jgi:hypothetical protein